MKRLAVFAHFDKNNIIEDYVVYYVNQLKKYCEQVTNYFKNELKEFLHDPSALRVGWEEFKNIVGCK